MTVVANNCTCFTILKWHDSSQNENKVKPTGQNSQKEKIILFLLPKSKEDAQRNATYSFMFLFSSSRSPSFLFRNGEESADKKVQKMECTILCHYG